MGIGTTQISVVIPTKNRSKQLSGLLDTLSRCRQPANVSVEIIVVDSSPSLDTLTAVAKTGTTAPFPIRYIYEAAGTSRARNTGASHAEGSIIAFTDDDCLLPENWLETIWTAFQEMPELTGVYGRVLPADTDTVDVLTLSVKPSLEAKDFRFPCSPFVGHSNNMAIRRAALLAIGGFDPSFGPGAPLRAAEELEMNYRLLRKGHWLRYDPRITARHIQRESAALSIAAHRRNAVGIAAFFLRHSLLGDLFAVKAAWWWWNSLLREYARAARTGGKLLKRVKATYLVGSLEGLWVGLGHEVSSRL